jgi:hypothetical protein
MPVADLVESSIHILVRSRMIEQAQGPLTIRELYQEALLHKHNSLILLIQFLVYEKKTICFSDDTKALDLYFKPNNKTKLNNLLAQYERER